MSASRPESGPAAISRFRAVVVAASRVRQLRRGAKPRIDLDSKKRKDVSIAIEEVRRGLISFRPAAGPQVQDPKAMGELKTAIEQSVPVVGSISGFKSF